MMTEQEKYELIEAYLADSLTEGQRQSFVLWQKENPDWQKEVEQHRELADALGPSSFNQMRSLHQQILAESRPVSNIKKSRGRTYLWLAAGLALLLTAAWLIFMVFERVAASPEQLFAQYYEAPPQLSISRTDQPNIIEASMLFQATIDSLYQHGAYQEALSFLETEGSRLTFYQSSDYYYWQGILHLQNQEPAQAVASFQQVQIGHADEKRWYMSLAQLKLGRVPEAKAGFEALLLSDGPYGEEARGILEQLE